MGAVTVQGFVCWCVFALPRIPLWRRNHWIIKAADANRGEWGVSSGARLLGEARWITSNKRKWPNSALYSHIYVFIYFNWQKCARCVIETRMVFFPLLAFKLLWHGSFVSHSAVLAVSEAEFRLRSAANTLVCANPSLKKRREAVQDQAMWLSRSAGSIWDCHQSCCDLLCRDRRNLRGASAAVVQATSPAASWHFKNTHGWVGG